MDNETIQLGGSKNNPANGGNSAGNSANNVPSDNSNSAGHPPQPTTPPNPIEKTPEAEKKIIKEAEKKGNILKVTKKEQYKTVSELMERSQSNSVYYTLLILSIFIVGTGLLLGNAPIVIGGMLVTPVLTPILVIALGITVGELRAVKDPIILITKSVFITIAASALLAFIFGAEGLEKVFISDIRTAILYFIVAGASGMAATFAWVRKQVADILPGISIAVSLVPPLSLVGIYLGFLDFETVRFYLLIFILNFIGILIGAIVVFSLLHFSKSGNELKHKIDELEKVKAYHKAEKKAQDVAKKMEQIKKNIEQADKLEKKNGA